MRCRSCGFAFFENPHWLPEAYGNTPVSPYDVSSPSRAICNVNLVEQFVREYCTSNGPFVDFGGGTGLLVRLLRDRGINFYRSDPFCTNIYAQFFDWDANPRPKNIVELATSFEVFEHLTRPKDDLAGVASWAQNLLFSTALQPIDNSDLAKWFYLIPECGQHVSFHTDLSLRKLATHFGFYYMTNGRNLHLYTKHPERFSNASSKALEFPLARWKAVLLAVTRKIAPEITRQTYPGHNSSDYDHVKAAMLHPTQNFHS